MITIEAKKNGSDAKTVSKLNLVDLAGSERVYKSGTDDKKILNEGININGSLHFLEMVIVALNKKARGEKDVFIPYRNSMMTMVLRDSLGGNCKTKMIATMSPDPTDIAESISTCKFAVRVMKV